MQKINLELQSPMSEKSDKFLCFYQNQTQFIQIIRIKNKSQSKLEKVVFPGQRLLFEALEDGLLEIQKCGTGSLGNLEKIPCDRLQVVERARQ